MAKYSELTDYTDVMITISEDFLESADAFIDLKLRNTGIDLTAVSSLLPIKILTEIAVNYANSLACNVQSVDKETVLIAKGEKYLKTALMLLDGLTAESIGIIADPPSTIGFYSIQIARG